MAGALGVDWGGGCRRKGGGVIGQVEEAEIETEGFNTSRRSQKGLLVSERSILSAWGIRAAMK